MLRQPQRQNRDLVREIVQFNPVKLADVDAGQPQGGLADLERRLLIRGVESFALKSRLRFFHQRAIFRLFQFLENEHFQPPQFLIGDDEKIAGTASGVKNAEPVNAIQQFIQPGDGAFGFFKFLIKFVQKQRTDDLHDVRHGGIVHPQLGALLVIHHALKHGAENIGIDLFPAFGAEVNEPRPRFGGKNRHVGATGVRVGEQAAVHIRENFEMGLGLVPRLRLGVQRHEQLAQKFGDIGAVNLRVGINRLSERLLWENAGVLGEIAKQEPGEKNIQRVPLLPRLWRIVRPDEVVKLRHVLGGFDIRLGLSLKHGALHAGQRQEKSIMFVQLGDWKCHRLVFPGVKGGEILKIRGDQETRFVAHDLPRPLRRVNGFGGCVGFQQVRQQRFKIDFGLEQRATVFFREIQIAGFEPRNRGLRRAKGGQEIINKRVRLDRSVESFVRLA